MNAAKREVAAHEDSILATLRTGHLEIRGQLTFGSNYSFLTMAHNQQSAVDAVYKPLKGGYPLWDFDSKTLACREVAAYRVSHAIGWDFVPPTIIREDAPSGTGSLQLFIDHDPELNFFYFSRKHAKELKRVALFDMIINNADRKGSHMILDRQDRIWLIDHGLCFHTDPKLRTVIWNFSGKPIPKSMLKDAEHFALVLSEDAEIRRELSELLNPDEIKAIQTRIKDIIKSGIFPFPDENRRPYPWPLI